jgi:hypothetical protein
MIDREHTSEELAPWPFGTSAPMSKLSSLLNRARR